MKTMFQDKRFVLSILGIGSLGMLAVPLFDWPTLASELGTDMMQGVLTRALGGLVFWVLLVHLGYRVFRRREASWKTHVIWILPGVLIAINNFPIIAHVNGWTDLTVAPVWIVWFAIECLMIGWFEELVFRGAILSAWAERGKRTKQGLFLAVVGSSALFGLIHLLNLTAGAGLVPTLLQVGYSFGMGMLWAVVYLKTGNLWYPILLHALYNFTGSFFVRLGTMTHRYDALTIVLTIGFALLATGYYLMLFSRIDVDKTVQGLSAQPD